MIPSSNSAGEESSSPLERITIVSSRGERLQRSNRLISVRCKSHTSASASWESPTRVRWRRRFAANCSRTRSMANTVAGRRRKVYRRSSASVSAIARRLRADGQSGVVACPSNRYITLYKMKCYVAGKVYVRVRHRICTTPDHRLHSPDDAQQRRARSTDRNMAGAGFEPAKAEPTRLQRVPFDRSGTPPGGSR